MARIARVAIATSLLLVVAVSGSASSATYYSLIPTGIQGTYTTWGGSAECPLHKQVVIATTARSMVYVSVWGGVSNAKRTTVLGNSAGIWVEWPTGYRWINSWQMTYQVSGAQFGWRCA